MAPKAVPPAEVTTNSSDQAAEQAVFFEVDPRSLGRLATQPDRDTKVAAESKRRLELYEGRRRRD